MKTHTSPSWRTLDVIEPLEARISPALITATWLGGDGNWNDPSKWSTGVVPNNGGGNDYHVVLDVPGTVTITAPGSIAIFSLSNAEHLDITGSYFSPAFFRLTGGGTLTNTGTIELTSDEAAPDRCQLYFDDTTSITGTGDFLLTNYPMLNGAPDADVTIGVGQKIHGHGVVNVPLLDNAGIIDADAGRNLNVTTTGVNTGTLLASNGLLRLINSSIDNTAGILKADGGTVDVANTSLPGGQWIATDNPASRIMLIGNVNADGASWQALGAGEFQVNRTTATLSGDVAFTGGKFSLIGEYYAPLRFEMTGGTFTNNGTIEVVFDASASDRGLFWISGNTTLDGAGGVNLIGNPLLATAPGATLTLDVGQKLHGHGIVTGSYVNNGTIEADSTAGPLSFNGPTISNADGTLRASGGRLAVNNGTTITGGDLAVTDDAASVMDFAGTIGVDGTTWTGVGAGLFRVNYGTATTLNGSVHLAAGEFDILGQYYAGVLLNLGGGTWTNDGIIKLVSDNALPDRGQIFLNGDVLLNGDGELLLVNTPMISGAAGTRLTVGADVFIHGSGVVNVPLLTNNGTMTADAAGLTLTVRSAGVNTNLMNATAGTLLFDTANLTNTGATIRADGATVTLQNCTITGGDIIATDNVASRVFLNGTVNADATTWRASGAGEFQVSYTTATLNGNVHLASGKFTLIGQYYAPMRLNLGGGTFTNDGTIELVSDNAAADRGLFYLNSDLTLAGIGEFKLTGTPKISGADGTKLTLGAGQVLHGFGYVTVPGLDNAGIIGSDVADRTLVVTAAGANTGLMHASAGTLQLNGSNFANTGAELRADGGIVELVNSTVTGGNFTATDDAASRVRFAGNVNADGTTWTTTGAGEFQVNRTTATLSGAMHLTSGKFSLLGEYYAPLRLNLASGAIFANDGHIELVLDNQNADRGLLWIEGNATLNGSGDLQMINNPKIATAPGATLAIGAGQKVHGFGYITGSFTNEGTIEADAGANTLHVYSATIANTGGALRGNAGRLSLENATTITGGALAVTNDAASLIDFSGTVGVDGTTWNGAGAGRFQVPYTTTTLTGSVHLAVGQFDILGQYFAPGRLNLGGATWTNDGVIRLVCDNHAPDRGMIYLDSSMTLDGSGELRLFNTPLISGAAGTELTIGAAQVVHGFGYIAVPTVRNEGRIAVDEAGDTLVVQSDVINSGELVALGGIYGRALVLNGHVTLTGDGTLGGDATGLITIAHDIIGDTAGGVRIVGTPNIRIDGPSNEAAPQWVEVMDTDLGWTNAGFAGVYGYRSIELNGAYVRLQNTADNATGSEAIYIDTLNVYPGNTLDLNGQRIYVRTGNLTGTIIGDAGAPTSSVTAMPAFWLGSDLNVQWSGEDDVGGTGLAAFDIYVSDNGGAFTLWLDDTTATSASFPAEDGHTYAFYSIARDNIGYVEAAPAMADASVEVRFLAIDSTPVITVNEDATYNYDVASNADGIDGAGLVWSLVFPPPQLAIDPATGVVTGTFDNAAVGGHDVTVRVTDNQGHHVQQSFTLTVANVPGAFADQTVPSAMLGQPFAFDLDSTDEGIGGTAYTLSAGPAWLSVDAVTGVLSGTPARPADLASTAVTVRVDDQHGGTDEQVFTLDVQGQLITLDPALRQTKATFTDANGDLVTVAMTGKDGRVHLLRSIAPDGNGDYSNLTPADLFAIQLDGTTLKDGLTVTVKYDKRLQAGDKLTTLGELGGTGSLTKLAAPALDLIGTGIALPADTIATLTLHDVKNGADITLGGAQALKGVGFTAHDLDDGSALAFGSTLKLLKANEWTGGTLAAPSAGSLRVAGDLNADLTFAGPVKLLRAGNFSGGSVHATSLGSLTVGDDASFDLTLTDALAKTTLGRTRIGGDLLGSVWDVAGKIASITVARTIGDTIIRSGTDITTLSMGASDGSVFGAGVDLATLIANGHADTAPTGTIKTFKVNGWKIPKLDPIPRFMEDTQVSAKIGTMSLHNWDGLGGLWAPAGAIKKITHHDTALKDAEHNWVYPEPARQVSGQPEIFVHLL